MKVCVTATQGSLEAGVDPRFGRCAFFMVVDTKTMEFTAIPNENAQAGGGAGIRAGQLIADQGAEAVLTGNVGPNAYQTLQAAGIAVITGVSGSVKEAVARYQKGELKSTDSPNVQSHFGIGRNS